MNISYEKLNTLVGEGNLDLFSSLIKSNLININDCIKISVNKDYVNLIKYLISQNVKFPYINLFRDVTLRNQELVIVLVNECGVKPDINSLNYVIRNTDKKLIKLFLDKGMDVNSISDESVQTISTDFEMVKLFMEYGLNLERIQKYVHSQEIINYLNNNAQDFRYKEIIHNIQILKDKIQIYKAEEDKLNKKEVENIPDDDDSSDDE